jgi:hypothetical protein
MNRAERVARIQRVLDELYPDASIPLGHKDPFTLLVAVLLSAQTTDARVNLVTPALFARADTPARMMKLSVAEIHELIKTCGLAPAKARRSPDSRILVGSTAARCRELSRSWRARASDTDGERRDGAGVRDPRLPRRHAHPPARPPLGSLGRILGRADRA